MTGLYLIAAALPENCNRLQWPSSSRSPSGRFQEVQLSFECQLSGVDEWPELADGVEKLPDIKYAYCMFMR